MRCQTVYKNLPQSLHNLFCACIIHNPEYIPQHRSIIILLYFSHIGGSYILHTVEFVEGVNNNKYNFIRALCTPTNTMFFKPFLI